MTASTSWRRSCKLTEKSLKVGKFSEITPTLTEGVQIATLKKEVEGEVVETPLYAPNGGGGGSTDWDEVYDVTLESAARLEFLPQKPMTKVYLYIKKPAGAASTQMRFQILSGTTYANGYTVQPFNANLQCMIGCTAGTIEGISRTYSDAQPIYAMGAYYWADDWGAKNITRIISMVTFDEGTRIVIKAKY